MSGRIYSFPTVGPKRLGPPVPGGKLCGMYPMAWRRGELVPHSGIDFCAPRGTPIIVPLPGVVTRRTVTKYGGNNVTVRHDGEFVTYYAHADEIFANVGQKVRKHEVIATVGNTGVTSSGATMDPHLHFQVQEAEDFSSQHYDPVAFLDSIGVRKDGLMFYWKDGFPKVSRTFPPLLAVALGAGVVVGSIWIARR